MRAGSSFVKVPTPIDKHLPCRLGHAALFGMSTGNTSPLLLPPYQGSVVRVSALDGGRIVLPASLAVQPPIRGHELLDLPALCFLVQNDKIGKKVMFDLGIMKAWKTKLGPVCESHLL
jgi:hypothetical protein